MRLIDAYAILYQEDDSGIKNMGYVRKGQIDSMPTIEAEPVKHGKWIEHHEPYDWMGYTTWSCSECDYEVGYEKDVRHRTKCCPNCGAEME